MKTFLRFSHRGARRCSSFYENKRSHFGCWLAMKQNKSDLFLLLNPLNVFPDEAAALSPESWRLNETERLMGKRISFIP